MWKTQEILTCDPIVKRRQQQTLIGFRMQYPFVRFGEFEKAGIRTGAYFFVPNSSKVCTGVCPVAGGVSEYCSLKNRSSQALKLENLTR